MQMIQLSVAGLALDPRNSQPIVVLNDASKLRALPIWIGGSEARAISIALEHVRTKRPITHELLLSTIKQLGYQVQQVEIDAVNSDTYFSTIRLIPRGAGPRTKDERSIDARPSDAIALALAADAPIYASPEVIEAGAVELASEEGEKESTEFKKFIDEVKASDFTIPGMSVTAVEDDEPGPNESNVDKWK